MRRDCHAALVNLVELSQSSWLYWHTGSIKWKIMEFSNPTWSFAKQVMWRLSRPVITSTLNPGSFLSTKTLKWKLAKWNGISIKILFAFMPHIPTILTAPVIASQLLDLTVMPEKCQFMWTCASEVLFLLSLNKIGLFPKESQASVLTLINTASLQRVSQFCFTLATNTESTNFLWLVIGPVDFTALLVLLEVEQEYIFLLLGSPWWSWEWRATEIMQDNYEIVKCFLFSYYYHGEGVKKTRFRSVWWAQSLHHQHGP